MAPGPPLTDWIATVEQDAASTDPLDLLAAAVDAAADLDRTKEDLLGHFVDRCRGAGRSWTEISTALGVTKQAAHRRFAVSDPAATSRFTPRAQLVLEQGPEVARSFNHATVGTEHFLIAILGDPESLATRLLGEFEVTRAAVVTATLLLGPRGAEAPTGVLPLSPRAVTAVKGAVTVALELGHNYVGTEHLLLALVRDPDAAATRILTAAGATPEQLRTRAVAMLNEIFAARTSPA